MLRTRSGYAGGTKVNPTYYDLGDHSETVQIDYDPARISYSELLAEFWDSHYALGQSGGTQYLNIAFYHNDTQKRLIQDSMEQIAKSKGGAVATLMRPYTNFYLAEDYHQKYYLLYQVADAYRLEFARSKLLIMKEIRAMYPEIRDVVNSTAAARLNGYFGGYGSDDVLREEIESYGLSDEGKKALIYVTGRKIGGYKQ